MIVGFPARPRGGLWDNPDFLRLWAAQSLSAVGTRFTREGLPIIAALWNRDELHSTRSGTSVAGGCTVMRGAAVR